MICGCSTRSSLRYVPKARGVLLTALLGMALGAGEGSARERPILRLMNEAIGAVEGDKACRPALPPVGRRPSLTDDPPTDELLSTLGILRRPQSSEEREALDTIRFLAAEGVHRDHVRIARSASGMAFLIVTARDVSFYEPRPKRCVTRLRRRFGKLIDDRPRPFRRRARRALERIIRTEWTAPSEGEVEGVFMFDYTPGDVAGGSGGVSPRSIRDRGFFASRGRTKRSRVSGLLPDGVATLEATFTRLAPRGPGRPDKRYARAVTRAVPVQDNVVSFRVPRAPQDAFPARQVWRDAAGEVIAEIDSGGRFSD
jgi:hypothetical protein